MKKWMREQEVAMAQTGGGSVTADRTATGDWLVAVHDGEDGSVHTISQGTAEDAAAEAVRTHIEMQPEDRRAVVMDRFKEWLHVGVQPQGTSAGAHPGAR